MTSLQQPASVVTGIDLAYRVARNVRAEVARSGETQAQISALLGVNQQAVSAKMRGKTPITLRELDLLARHWGMSPADLIVGNPGPHPNDNGGITPTSPCLSFSRLRAVSLGTLITLPSAA